MTHDQNVVGGSAGRRDALPPDSVLGTYRVERVLGSGGFGIVYLAHHEELGRQVAIKEYLPVECAVRDGLSVGARGEEYREAFEQGLTRFRDEALRLVELEDHPAIVSCRDFFRANGTAYLVMEYAEGDPLSEVLRAREAEGRSFGQADLLNVMIPLLEGLAEVHAAGVIHRDIKPGNIMIRKHDGHPVLIDFGAAKQGAAEVSKSMAPFTEGYAAVEQVGDGKLGPWTDIYAVGAVMWRMVAGGNPPWEPPTPVKVESRASAQLSGEDDPLPSVRVLGKGRFPEGVLTVIENCLRLQAAGRVQNCGEILGILREEPLAVDGDPDTADSRPRSGNGFFRKSRGFQGLVIAFGSLLLAGALVTDVLSTDEPDPDQASDHEPIAAPIGSEHPPDPEPENLEADGDVVLGTLSILPDPSNSKIEFLNIEESYLPGMALPPGRYRLRISAPGYQSTQLSIKLGNGPTVERIRLAPEGVEEGGGLEVPTPASSRNREDEVKGGGAGLNGVPPPPGLVELKRGLEHYRGVGVQRNYAEALASFRKAASYGRAEAKFYLGVMYSNGEGVPQDDGEAAAWFRRAAEQGNSEAQFNLGLMYDVGRGVPQDYGEAVAWYRRAAEQGEAWAQLNLGAKSANGEGLPQDDGEAVAWFRRAAKQGHALAQRNVGLMYYNGKGVPRDYVRAYAWLSVSAAHGNEDAKDYMDTLSEMMTREQVADAQRLSHELMPQ